MGERHNGRKWYKTSPDALTDSTTGRSDIMWPLKHHVTQRDVSIWKQKLLTISFPSLGEWTMHPHSYYTKWSHFYNADKDILYIPINDITENDIIQATHILIAMPFVQESSSLWHTVLEHFFNSSSEENPKWLGMVSTSGVYGNHDGAWVSEESELRCSPKSSAFAYQEWEKEFEQASARSKSTNVRIFRCSGIYDSSKSALHTVWKSGFEKPNRNSERGNTKTNRIHSFDIAQAIVASMHSTISGTLGDETLSFRI